MPRRTATRKTLKHYRFFKSTLDDLETFRLAMAAELAKEEAATAEQHRRT